MDLIFNEACKICPLAHRRGTYFPVNPKWHRSNPLKYMFVAEAPGQTEEEKGETLVGKSGQLLRKCIEAAGISLDDCLFTNSCWCAPKDMSGKIITPQKDEYLHCIPNALNLVRRYKPMLIVAVGKISLDALIRPKNELKVTTQRGKFFNLSIPLEHRYEIFRSWVKDLEDYFSDGSGEEKEFLLKRFDTEESMISQIEFAKSKGYSEDWVKIPVMPIVHPSFALRTGVDGRWTESIIIDLQVGSIKVDEEAIKDRPKKNYKWINDVDELNEYINWVIESFKSGITGPVAVDVETSEELGEAGKIGLMPLDPRVRLLTIQFSHEKNQGVSLMVSHRESVFNDPAKFATLRQKLVEFFENVDVVGHNFQFDAKAIRCRLGIKDFRLVGDTMLMFHWLHAGKGLGLGLDELGARLLGTGLHKRESHEWREKNPGGTFEDMPLSLSLDYSSGDTDITLQSYQILKKQIEEDGRWDQYFDHHHGVHDVWKVISDLEWYGMPVDQSILNELSSIYPKKIDDCVFKLHKNPFILSALMDKVAEHNAKIDIENEKIREYNNNIPSGSKKKPRKFKKKVESLQEWVNNRKNLFNPNSVPQVSSLWKKTIRFPWHEIHDLEYGDIDPKKGKYNNKKFGEKPKTNAHNRKILIEFAEGNLKKVDKISNDELKRYWSSISELLRDLDYFKKLSKNYTSYVKGIYPLIIDKPTTEVPYNPSERCFHVYSPYSDFPRPWSLHPSYHLAGTETGRLSSSDPNGQAFPKKVIGRDINVKRPYVSRWSEDGGVIIQPDYSQLEVRVLVMLAGEKQMAEAINRGEDVHRFVASLVGGCEYNQVVKEQRAAAKNVTFGIVYGQGIPAMAQILGISEEEAQSIQDTVFARVPALKKFIEDRHQEAYDTGRVVGPTGRVCWLPHIKSDHQGEVNKALRNSVNAPIQGAGSELCAQSFGRTWKRLREFNIKAVPFSVIHDSQTFDAAPGYFFDVIEAQYYEMVWAQYNFYDWLICKPEADFDLGSSWGTMVSAELQFDDKKVNFDHNRLNLSGDKEDIYSLIDSIKKGGQEVKIEKDGPHHQKEEAEKGKHETLIYIERDPVCIVEDKKLLRLK